MRSKVGNWGGSAAIRLPRHVVEQLGIREGGEVEVTVEGGSMVVRPLKPRYTLAELLEQAETMQRPQMVDDTPVGAEWP